VRKKNSGAFIYDDEQEKEKQRALEAFRREEEQKRKEIEFNQQKQLKQQKKLQKQSNQSTQKSLQNATSDSQLEKQNFREIKKRKRKTKKFR